MAGDRLRDLVPLATWLGGDALRPHVDSVKHVKERLVDVRRGGDERSPVPDNTVAGNPVEGIAPAVFLVPATARLLELGQEVNRPGEIRRISRGLVQETVAHRVMSIGNRKSKGPMEEPPGRRRERLAEHHGSNGRRTEQTVPVIERLRSPAERAGVKALMVE